MFGIKHLIKGNYMILKRDLIFYNFLNILKKIFIIYQFGINLPVVPWYMKNFRIHKYINTLENSLKLF